MYNSWPGILPPMMNAFSLDYENKVRLELIFWNVFCTKVNAYLIKNSSLIGGPFFSYTTLNEFLAHDRCHTNKSKKYDYQIIYHFRNVKTLI